MDRSATIDAIVKLTALTLPMAERIADDFLSFNPHKDESTYSHLERVFAVDCCHGRDGRKFLEVIELTYQVDRKQALIISRSFSAKEKLIKSLLIAKNNDIENFTWSYRQTCQSINRTDHELFNGKEFSPQEGLMSHYGKTMPGIEIGCACDMRPIILAKSNAQKNESIFSKIFGIFSNKRPT